MVEKRHPTSPNTPNHPAALPVDYLKMVEEVFTSNFSTGLKILKKFRPNPYFKANGWIFSDEILLSVSIVHPNHLSAITAHASCDFDPQANSPTVEELLAICVDALGSSYSELLPPDDEQKIQLLTEESLSAIENVASNWTATTINKKSVFLKLDRTNPDLEKMTADWLLQNDPELKKKD